MHCHIDISHTKNEVEKIPNAIRFLKTDWLTTTSVTSSMRHSEPNVGILPWTYLYKTTYIVSTAIQRRTLQAQKKSLLIVRESTHRPNKNRYNHRDRDLRIPNIGYNKLFFVIMHKPITTRIVHFRVLYK